MLSILLYLTLQNKLFVNDHHVCFKCIGSFKESIAKFTIELWLDTTFILEMIVNTWFCFIEATTTLIRTLMSSFYIIQLFQFF